MVAFPWEQYSKDALPKNFAYPVGRDLVQHELELAGAAVSSLSFRRPDRHSGGTVLDVHWSGDSSRRIADVIPEGGSLLMALLAVPSETKQTIGDELRDRWLGEAARWMAGITEQGDAWRSVEHRWLLRHQLGRLSLSTT